MFFKKKKKILEFDRNLSTEDADKMAAEATKGMSPEMLAIMDFLTYAEKLSMSVDTIGGNLELARRMSEPKTKVVLLVLNWFQDAKANNFIPDTEKADIARKAHEELVKHMKPNEFELFDEKYISAMEHGELFLQKLMAKTAN